jgi:excisionase family DNA binding protein
MIGMRDSFGQAPTNASTTAARSGLPPRLLYTIETAAYMLGVGRSSVYNAIWAGELEAVHIGRSVRIPADALTAFVQRLQASE